MITRPKPCKILQRSSQSFCSGKMHKLQDIRDTSAYLSERRSIKGAIKDFSRKQMSRKKCILEKIKDKYEFVKSEEQLTSLFQAFNRSCTSPVNA
ncbi:hypothetical protein Tco_1527354 [Tanacetum coccineum]